MRLKRAMAMGAVVGICAASGCGRKAPPAPPSAQGSVDAAVPARIFPFSGQANDPADENNWPKDWTGKDPLAYFGSFVFFAETNPDWLMLGSRGEAVYVRVDRSSANIKFVGETNKIESLDASGGVQALSMRRYVTADSVKFDLKASSIDFVNVKERKNPYFFVPAGTAGTGPVPGSAPKKKEKE